MKKLLIIAFLILSGVSFAQSGGAGLTFTDFLNSQAQTPDTIKTDTSAAVAKPVAYIPQPPVTYSSYEAFLDSIEAYASAILPEKEWLDSEKAAENAKTDSPKDEFEKQIDYEKRIADFEKTKQQKILALEQEYQERTKENMDKLRAGITFKGDIQPDWAGTLKKDAGIEEYKRRINEFTNKISAMNERISQITALFGKLEFNKSNAKTLPKHWQDKNLLYISRLERACELMQDYIIQEQAKVLSTEKYKFAMDLGAYNADKEEFEFNMNDIGSPTVPFDYSGIVKMSPQQAKETNRQTDDFTASVDYLNFPLIVDGSNLYPAAKKAHVFYKEYEIPTSGIFKKIPDLDKYNGYSEWLAYADSLLSGKLSPRNLDSLYAMKASINAKNKVASGDGFWTNRNIFRVAMFGLSAASFALGISQNSDANSKSKKAREAYDEYINLPAKASPQEKSELYQEYKKNADDTKSSENWRTGFYVGAGLFGIAGAASFFF